MKPDKEMLFKDEYGDSLGYYTYYHKTKDEYRVQVGWSPRDDKHDDYLYDNDIQLDFTVDEFLELTATMLDVVKELTGKTINSVSG